MWSVFSDVLKPLILCYTADMDILHRNSLRAEALLPLLDIAAETERLEAVRAEAAFEREWRRRKPEFAHEWTGNNDGWLRNMGRESMAKQKVRREMRDRHTA